MDLKITYGSHEDQELTQGQIATLEAIQKLLGDGYKEEVIVYSSSRSAIIWFKRKEMSKQLRPDKRCRIYASTMRAITALPVKWIEPENDKFIVSI